jgi:predicted DNA-binding transcriptional regulator AlpA
MAFGVCERTIARMVLRGDLPPPIRIGRSVRWPASVISTWVQGRAADAGTAVAVGNHSGEA